MPVIVLVHGDTTTTLAASLSAYYAKVTSPDEARIIRMAREVNEYKPEWVLEKVKAAIADALAAKPGATLSDIKVTCLGLAFKPDIDDLRESPALEITSHVAKLGCQVVAVEPNISELPSRLNAPALSLGQLDESLDAADVVCVLVKHKPFVEAIERIRSHSKTIDAVGLVAA